MRWIAAAADIQDPFVPKLEVEQPTVVFTLLLLVLHGPPTILGVIVSSAAVGMLISRRLRNAFWSWRIIGLLLTQGLLRQWFELDNHQFLLVYWVWGLYIAHSYPLCWRLVPDLARWLLGLTFLGATFWKVIGGEYWTGGFWEFMFLTDRRIAPLVHFGTGLSYTAGASNARLYNELLDPVGGPAAVMLTSSGAVGGLAIATSWLGMVLELTIAVSCLLVGARARSYLPYFVTLFLCVYLTVPVIGFAWIVAILCLAATANLTMWRHRAMLAMAVGLTLGRIVLLELLVSR